MARKPRINIANIPQHVIQRGNNRQACFARDEDVAVYAEWLRESAEENEVAIHSWVFMSNHVHLLATPKHPTAISKMMQTLGRKYVRYFNYSYERTGTLWEGRFKSCLVESDLYVVLCSRYIELNPVRAGMVDDPKDYSWSSYSTHAFGIESKLWTPHDVFLELGKNHVERQQSYRELFKEIVADELLDDIRKSLNKGLILGTERFKDEIESLLNRRVRPGEMGRPRKVIGKC
jgi:putative transposase